MSKITQLPGTGVIIGRDASPNGEESIAVAVKLPRAMWDELTAGLVRFEREALYDARRPDFPLEARIALFVEMETSEWEARCSYRAIFDTDLDDDVPF